MEWLIEFLKPPILPALFVAIGLALLNKPLSYVLSGAIKSMIGYVLLEFGAKIAGSTVETLTTAVMDGFGVSSVLLNSELMGATLMMDYGAVGFCVMLVAIFVNIFIARNPRTNGMYLTGHHLLYSSLLITFLLSTITELPVIAVIAIGGALVGVYAGLTVKATQSAVKKVTGKDDIGFANSGNTAALIGSLIGKVSGEENKFEKGSKSRFEIKDVSVLSSIVMFLYYLFFNTAAGYTGHNWILPSLISSVQFGAAISVVFLGMRMLLADVVQITYMLYLKFAPDAIKGLDASAVISYSPSAWMWGFAVSFGSGVAVMAVSLLIGVKCVVIPGVASCFFTGGASAVFANASGGKRGVIISSAVIGVLIPMSVTLLLSSAPGIGNYGIAFGEVEYGIWGGLIGWLLDIVKMF